MYQRFENRIERLQQNGQAYLLSGGKKGVEKESLRVSSQGILSQTKHPFVLGSTLTNPYITTDYSEALLELITPPFEDVMDTMNFMQAIHQFIYANVHDELLWNTSMPCIVDGEKSIRIAEFGSSHIGMMKHIYRRGLAVRYGRIMQAISGVHFNYSVPIEFWPAFQQIDEDTQPLQSFINNAYFGLARNVLRYQWLLTYLFGNSPALCKSFMDGQDTSFQSFDASTYYEPYAASLRVSDIGYTNRDTPGLDISYDNLDTYVRGLIHAIETPYQPFVDKGIMIDGEYWQLNGNILQIENEYYSAVRPKQPIRSGERPSNALSERGVMYVEIRVLDIDTFSPIGVNEMQLRFMEAFALFCLLQESTPIDAKEERDYLYNQQQIANVGRMPGLMLRTQGQEVSLVSWAMDIMTQLEPICEALDQTEGQRGNLHKPYQTALAHQKQLIGQPELTPSARMLDEMKQANETFATYALRKSREHQATLQNEPMTNESIEKTMLLLEEEAIASIEKQREMEANETLSFEEYLVAYFAK
ncbi:MAG: glutamate--cysteine ligase [Chloroflexota bacterium]